MFTMCETAVLSLHETMPFLGMMDHGPDSAEFTGNAT
jgi:hypothetical protein